MTDARLPSRWLLAPEYEGLSDRAYRIHFNALMWSNEAGTDGLLLTRSLRLLHPEGFSEAAGEELVDAGLWEPRVGGAFQILNWEHTQSTAAEVEYQHERNRRKNRAARQRAREAVTGPVTEAVTGPVTEAVTELGGGEARRGEEEVKATTEQAIPVLQIVASEQKSADADGKDRQRRSPRPSPNKPASEKQLSYLRDLHFTTEHEAPSGETLDLWESWSAEQADEAINTLHGEAERLKMRNELDPADVAHLSDAGQRWLREATGARA